jgi:trans-aconitate 2-methyltransferase
VTEWSGEDYANIGALQRAMANEATASLKFHGDERVLDVGCGDGHVTRTLAGMVPRGYVVGVDPSRGMLTEAIRIGPVNPAGPSYVRADARHLPFTQFFDAAVSFNALHWVPEQRQALGQIASVVHPGASVLIQMVCASGRPSIEAVAMTVCGQPQWAPRFAGFTAPFIHVEPAAFTELAAEAGLTVTGLTVSDREWDFGTGERFARWCAVGTTAWTDRLAVGERPEFVSELVNAYEAVAGRPGLFRFTQMRVELARH